MSRRAFLKLAGVSAATVIGVNNRINSGGSTAYETAVLAQQNSFAANTIYGNLETSPGKRACCMLTPNRIPARIGTIGHPDNDNIVEPVDLMEPHVYGVSGLIWVLQNPNNVGIIYSCDLGFIDLGHLRDLADLTFFYYKQIDLGRKNKAGMKLKLFDYEGEVKLLKDIQASDYIDVACRMAYDEAIFHEIETYWVELLGCHHSSFSPEDLVSNTLGTFVAKLSLSAPFSFLGDRAFELQVTTQLPKFLATFGLASKLGTEEALSKAENTLGWTQGSSYFSSYLRRRNFGLPIGLVDMWPFPWTVPELTTCSAPLRLVSDIEWRPRLIGPPQDFYTARYRFPDRKLPDGMYIEKKDGTYLEDNAFLTEIQAIRRDAESRYGSDYDKPF
jgi:hypothetical protein